MLTVFFSYSHRDEEMRNELEVHLAQLKNERVISTWHDGRIDAGSEWAPAINTKLETCDVILLLVSPYFLASKFCYEIEMTRALERHEAGAARVIPVILEPCDWHSAPFGKLQAGTRDGKPISKYANKHDGYLEVARQIREIAKTLPNTPASTSEGSKSQRGQPATVARSRSSNLRIKREFTDHDRDTFLHQGFEFIANYFEESLNELKLRHADVSTSFQRLNAIHFTAAIYRKGKCINRCGIRLSGQFGGSSITFAFDPEATNTSNESVRVEGDDCSLHFQAMGLSSLGDSRSKGHLSSEGAGELFWAMLISPLQ